MLSKWIGRRSRERRAWVRESKRQQVLLLLDDCALGEPYRGVLLDTSAGGLRLAVPRQEVAEGTVVWLRSASASDETAWLGVRVKHRRRREHFWEMGCAFTQGPFRDGPDLFA